MGCGTFHRSNKNFEKHAIHAAMPGQKCHHRRKMRTTKKLFSSGWQCKDDCLQPWGANWRWVVVCGDEFLLHINHINKEIWKPASQMYRFICPLWLLILPWLFKIMWLLILPWLFSWCIDFHDFFCAMIAMVGLFVGTYHNKNEVFFFRIQGILRWIQGSW